LVSISLFLVLIPLVVARLGLLLVVAILAGGGIGGDGKITRRVEYGSFRTQYYGLGRRCGHNGWFIMIFLLDNTTDKCIEMVPISTSKLWMCSNVLMFPSKRNSSLQM
jgi:hypothetical protein